MVPLTWYLFVAAILFVIGLFGVLSRRNLVGVLMSIELMLNAVNLNLVAFWRYLFSDQINGQAMVIFVFVVAAAEVAVGLALVIGVFRNRQRVNIDEINMLKW